MNKQLLETSFLMTDNFQIKSINPITGDNVSYYPSNQTGVAGPQGPIGLTGPQGPIGLTGPPVASGPFYLGQDTLGGIVYFIFKDAAGIQHGLIVNKGEDSLQWQTVGTVTGATRSWDGPYNTNRMTNSPAAAYVNGLTVGGFTDWYLPSVDELSLLWHNRYLVNKALNAIAGATILRNDRSGYYWSSNEYENSSTTARFFWFPEGAIRSASKINARLVRAVRAF